MGDVEAGSHRVSMRREEEGNPGLELLTEIDARLGEVPAREEAAANTEVWVFRKGGRGARLGYGMDASSFPLKKQRKRNPD